MTEAALKSYAPHLPAFRVAESKLRAAGLVPIADLIAERIRETEAYLAETFKP